MPKRKTTIIREVMQCQGERDYYNVKKDCDNCSHKYFCFANRANFYFRYILKGTVFAQSQDDAEEYFRKRQCKPHHTEEIQEMTLKEYKDYWRGSGK